MHPQLTSALGRLDAAAQDLRQAATRVPPPLQARKPASDRWSINEVLEHVSMVEQLFLKTLIAGIESAKASGPAVEVDEPPMLSDQLKDVVEDRTTRRNAPEHVHPSGNVAAEAALHTIAAGHAKLRDALQAAPDVALSRVTHDHRAFGTLNIYQWVDFLAGHERRHLAQVREIAAQLAGA